MKLILILFIVLLAIFAVLQIYTTIAINKTETQKYEVVSAEKLFEIRYYPAAVLAKISSQSKSYNDLANAGFGKLAQYIFGGNSDNKQIAMTSPVHMDIGEFASTMAFVMPSTFNTQNLPKPNNVAIVIETSAPEYAAVIKFGGFANNKSINKHKVILKKALNDIGLYTNGNYRFLGYNPPFQLFERRNEVIVSLNWDVQNTDNK